MQEATYILLGVYVGAAFGLMFYGLNCYVMVALFRRRRKSAAVRRGTGVGADLAGRARLPAVTTQIPLYNEMNVAERILRAVAAMRYPADKHEIQVLDDSTDETRGIVDRVAAELAAAGSLIRVIRRNNRKGFKAGALARGMACARGDLIAIFDADFVPSRDYLLRTVAFFLEDPCLGLVQARWGHINRRRSLLTRAQAIGIDGHFMIEQAARNWNGLFMNFNGTAGVWRRTAIDDGGGWQWDTLTEDMDLSYRVQLAGWRTLFLSDVVVPAEVPEDIGAFKSQQFRWAKGSIQTARKLLPRVLRARIPLFQKVQAVFHMTHYLVHPLMALLAVLALPVLLTAELALSPRLFTGLAALLLLSMAAPSSLYVVSQHAAYPHRWLGRLLCLPALVAVGVGIALSNSRAVLEALTGRPGTFVRTPKRGHREIKRYPVRLPALALLEIAAGLYCAASLGVYLAAGKYLVGPFLCIYAAGFLFVGMLSVAHSAGFSR